ncbi:MAG TPA: MopE-related protein [Myxococcota bacterium]|nr:MopE-related protein [Myxococcota bacterium]
MKRNCMAAILAATVLCAVACGGGGNDTDTSTANDAGSDVMVDSGTDAGTDAQIDSRVDVEGDAQDVAVDTTDVEGDATDVAVDTTDVEGDAADVAVDTTDVEGDAQDVAVDTTDVEGDAQDVQGDTDVSGGDQGHIDTATDGGTGICGQAVELTDGQELDAVGLPEGTPSAWDTYSCEPDSTWTGPERLYAFTSDCDGFVRFTVTPQGAPDGIDYLPVAVGILEDCSAGSCARLLPPAHPLTVPVDVEPGQVVYLVVEAMDTALPAFKIKAELFCRDCRDDDEDGFDGFNSIFCPQGTDCNDDDAAINPEAGETPCDGVDQDCSGFDACDGIVCADNDGDGYFNYDPVTCPMGQDCNDSNGAIGKSASDIECNGIDEDCDGMDWCPGTGQQCDPCLFMTGCREDHTCIPVIGDGTGFAAYCAKFCERSAECPYGSRCVPEVFEGNGVCLPYMQNTCSGGLMTVKDTCGNQISRKQCAGSCSVEWGICIESCPAPAPLTVGTTVGGRLDGDVSNIGTWPGVPDAPGPEASFTFTAECDGVARLVATEMADMQMFVAVTVTECVNTRTIAIENGDSFIHELEFPVVAGFRMFATVDSTMQGDSGPFTILVEIDCDETGREHCEPCEFDLQCDSGFCHRPGVPSLSTGACLKDCSLNGQCPEESTCTTAGDKFVCMPQTAGDCQGQDLFIQDSCGLSYLARTCPDGWQCNAGQADCTNSCVDGDSDGFFGHDDDACPTGNDCDDENSAINPAANDIRCNAIDEDCSGADNCSDAGQCEQCEGGHCGPGFYCFKDPNYDVPGICLADCTGTMECPMAPNWNLSCWSWMSGIGDDSYYCRPKITIECDGKTSLIKDGCDRTVETAACDIDCFDEFGCSNYCTATQPHPGCGKTVHGTTVGAPDRTNYYYNATDTRDDLTGPEVQYTFTASCTGEFNAVLTNATNWLTLVVVKNASGKCRSSTMIDYDVFLDTPDVVAFTATQGDEFTLIVDGMDGAEGEFDLTVNCLCGANCADNDSDGFIDRHATDCPSGSDCDGGNAAIHPGAAEIKCNDIDEDCTGYDDCRSDACTADVELGNLAAPVSRTDSRMGDTDQMTFYDGPCTSSYPRFNIETVYHFNPACSGTLTASVSEPQDNQYDIYLLADTCRADLCTKVAWYDLTAEVAAGTDYYLVIDGNSSATTNSWKLELALQCAD